MRNPRRFRRIWSSALVGVLVTGATGLFALPASAVVPCSSLTPCKVTVTAAPSSGVENQALSTVTVLVQDAVSLNPIPGAPVTISLNGGPGTLSGTTNGTTGSNGTVSFTAGPVTEALKISRAGSYSLTASTPSASGGSFSGNSSSFTVYDCTTAYPCSVAFTAQPADAIATKVLASDRFGNDGATHPIKVQVKDAAGQPVAGRSVTVSLSPNPSALSGTKTATTDSTGTGTASFSTLAVSTSGTGYALTASTPNPTSTSPFTGASTPFGVYDAGQNCPAGQLCDVSVSNSTTGQTTEVSFTSQGSWGLGVSFNTSAITDQQWQANCGGYNLAPTVVNGQPLGVPSGASGFAQWTTTIAKNLRLNSPAGVAAYRQCFARPAVDGTFAITTMGNGGNATGQSALITAGGQQYYIGAPANCPPTVTDVCVQSISAKPSTGNSGVAAVIEQLLAPVTDPSCH